MLEELQFTEMMLSPPASPRALIADDQPEVLEALRLLLKAEGCLAEVVTSPAAVLESLKRKRFDILLMDLNYARDTTSGQEGLDLLSQIQALDCTLPVIVMTGWGSVELAVEAMRRGVRDFVQKPWENERLLATLRAHITSGRAVRKRQRLEEANKNLTGRISAAADLHLLLKSVAEEIRRALQNRTVVIFTRAPHDHAFWATAQSGMREEILGRLKFEPESRVLLQMDRIFDPRQPELPEAEKQKLRDANAVLIVPVRLKNELVGFVCTGGKLSGEPYDEAELEFLTAAADHAGAGIDSLKLRGQEREYEEAREIQQGLLPKQIPKISGHDIFVAWRPASAVGGDYFDVLRFSNCSIALCIADVSGKGMPAALLMSNLQAAVKAFASESMRPKDLCSKVNRVLCSNISANKFITFFYCRHNAQSRRLAYTNAGHNAPVVLKRDGRHLRLQEGGSVLGVFSEWNYEQSEIEFAPGDKIVLFTDGVTEVRNSAGEEFGEQRLIALLVKYKGLRAEELQKRIMAAVAEFSGGEFQDDATLIIMSAD